MEKNKKSNVFDQLKWFKNNLERILKKFYIVIFIDELDNLYFKDKLKFASLIDFLNISAKGLIKICISNTLNLFVSQNNYETYLNYNYLIFKPYKKDTLKKILKKKVKRIFK